MDDHGRLRSGRREVNNADVMKAGRVFRDRLRRVAPDVFPITVGELYGVSTSPGGL